MRNFIVLLLFFTTTIILAQNANELFLNANKLYKEGNYKEAITIYNDIEKSGNVSSELYFNLANANYKLNNVAATIYNYEKALKLNPLNKDAQNNLIIAKRLTLDRIEALPKTVFQKLNHNFLQKLSYNNWAIITVILSFLAAILFVLFYFSYTPNTKRLYFSTSLIAFILLIAAFGITYTQYNQTTNTVEAIIFAEEVTIKNAPTNDANEIFTLHEGTKVNILDTVDNWKKIKLIDGKIGWVTSKNLKEF